MPSPILPDASRPSRIGAMGALCAASAVALSAYAAHAAQGAAQSRLQTAAIFAFGHGVALAALAPGRCRRLGRLSLLVLAIGVLLFSGSIAGNVLAQWPTALAPFGGVLLMCGWLMLAIDNLRR